MLNRAYQLAWRLCITFNAHLHNLPFNAGQPPQGDFLKGRNAKLCSVGKGESRVIIVDENVASFAAINLAFASFNCFLSVDLLLWANSC